MGSWAVIEKGVVTNTIAWDGAEDNPLYFDTEVELVEFFDGTSVSIGFTYDGKNFIAPPVPPPTPEQIKLANTRDRDGMLGGAALAIAPLQDAVDLDMATDEDIAMLKKWKLYRVTVNRTDLTVLNPSWPKMPS